MKKDDLLDFLDKVGARSLEDYLTQDFEDAQEGLDERLEWARSRLPDPRYSRAARFLVAHESELRTILREGEQAWLLRQVAGPLPRQRRPAPVLPPPPEPEDPNPTMAAPQLLSNPGTTPVPPLERGATDSFSDGEIWEYGNRSAGGGFGQVGLALAAGTYEGPGVPVNFDEPTMPTAWDTRTDETDAMRRAMPPLDSVLDPSTEYESQTSANELEDLFGSSILTDPATEAVEGDWERMTTSMPSIEQDSKRAKASRGGLFEDILDDHDTHASFDTSTAPPSRSGATTPPSSKGFEIPPEPWQEPVEEKAPAPEPVVAPPVALFAEPIEVPEPEPVVTPPPLEPQAPLAPPESEDVLAPTEEVERSEPEGPAPAAESPKKKRRYDPALIAASTCFGLAIGYLWYVAQPHAIHWWRTRSVTQDNVAVAEIIVEPTVLATPTDVQAAYEKPAGDTAVPADLGDPTEGEQDLDTTGTEGEEGLAEQSTDQEPEVLAITLPTAASPTPGPTTAPAPILPPEPAPRPVVPAPRPVGVAPTPQPVEVQPAPRPAAPVVPRPKPVVTQPTPDPKPATQPAPARLGPSGTWSGTNGSGNLSLRIESVASGRLAATAIMTVSGAKRTVSMRGTYNARTGAVSLQETGGTLTMTGTFDATTGQGSWSPGEGTTTRQWFVVRK
jgi:hypothetical protein